MMKRTECVCVGPARHRQNLQGVRGTERSSRVLTTTVEALVEPEAEHNRETKQRDLARKLPTPQVRSTTTTLPYLPPLSHLPAPLRYKQQHIDKKRNHYSMLTYLTQANAYFLLTELASRSGPVDTIP
ncbi:hypothetical protein CBL_04745 [Carabus blaptoides fortunei]